MMLLVPLLKLLTNNGETKIVWKLAARYMIEDEAMYVVSTRAAKTGNVQLMKRLLWAGREDKDPLIRALRFLHWDVVRLFHRSIKKMKEDALAEIATISYATYEGFFGRYVDSDLVEPKKRYLTKWTLINVYRFGFDQELLIEFCSEPIQEVHGELVQGIRGVIPTLACANKYHPTAPQTLRFLLKKHPNIGWENCIIEDFLGYKRDHIWRGRGHIYDEMEKLLLEAGCPCES